MTTLDAVTLPDDTIWLDQFEQSTIDQTEKRTIGGRLIIEQAPRNSGRPITLDCLWLTLTTVRELEALRNTMGAVFVLQLPNHTFSVMFRHHDSPALAVTQIIDYPDEDPNDRYNVQIKLMEI